MGLTVAMPEAQTHLAVQDPFEPNNMPDLLRFADMVSKSDFAPKDFKGKTENCAIAMLFGRQLGVPALQAIQNIAVIGGRPTIYGDLMWALIVSHPDFEDCIEDVNDTRAEVTLKRRGRTAKTVTFSVEDAKKAGLWGKTGPWSQYPKIQMLWRARTFAARNLFADALKGITSREEVMDYIEGEVVDPDPRPTGELERAQARTAAAEEKARFVTDIQIKEWNKARKESGKTPDDARNYIEQVLNIKRSGEMRVEDFDAAMLWAKAPVTLTAEALEMEQATGDEKAVRQEMERRGVLPFAVGSFIERNSKDGVTDWPAVMADVQANA